MTPEKQYKYAVEIIRELAKYFDFISEGYIEDWIKEPSKFFKLKLYDADSRMLILGHAFELLQDALTKMDKKASPNISIPALKSVIKEASISRKDQFAGMFKSNGMYCVCDGYRLICLNDDITSLPHRENHTFDIDKVMKGVSQSRKELHLPSVAEIKAKIALAPKGTPPVILVDNLVLVNAKFLLTMIQSLPECVAYIPNSMYDAILFESKVGKGILLPIRIHNGELYDKVQNNWKELRKVS